MTLFVLVGFERDPAAPLGRACSQAVGGCPDQAANRRWPSSVLYDPALTVTVPAAVSVTSGMNAVAHAVEALYAPDASPVIDLMAEEGVRALADALPDLVADGADLDARARAQYGACLGATTMSLHHKLCHALGGTLDLPHAPTHTVVLPHVLAYCGQC